LTIAYIVDEEPFFTEVIVSTLRITGFNEVKSFSDASEAYSYISINIDEASNALMFIDVALEPGEDEDRFSGEKTSGFGTTGLVLAKEILSITNISADKMILYSAHFTTELWNKINDFCAENGTDSWQKRADAELEDIIRFAENYLKNGRS